MDDFGHILLRSVKLFHNERIIKEKPHKMDVFNWLKIL